MRIRFVFFIFILSFSTVSCSEQNNGDISEVPYQSIMIRAQSGALVPSERSSGTGYITSPVTQLPPITYSDGAAMTGAIVSYPDLGITRSIDPACPQAHIVENDVRGSSMVPLFVGGDVVQYSSGYYQCSEVSRGDIIIYHLPNNLIIKRVVAVPGDTWRYQTGNIIINEKILTNTEGNAYNIRSPMLELYSHSYPTIPPNTYMILGNHVDGTLDASRFGLVARQDIIGKVILKNGKPLETR